MLSRTGTSKVIFGYNGRDGVVTDDNGLIYMRARYYSPEMKRFINADIIAGAISNAITLNRYAYANGNPVSFIDPFGLSAWSWLKDKYNKVKKKVVDTYNDVKDYVVDTYNDAKKAVSNAYRETKEWVTDTYQDVKERVVNTYNDVKEKVVDTYQDVKEDIQNAAAWVDNNIVKPAGEAITSAGKQIKDGLTTVANVISENVGAKVSVGKEESAPPQYYIFATVEEGIGYSKDFGDEKPITFFASAGENWWEFWERSVGVDINFDGYGAGFSMGGENSISVHAGNISHEVSTNTLGRISHKVAYEVGDGYVYSKYSLNGPETAVAVVGVAAAVYYGGSAVLSALAALASAWASSGAPLPA